MIGSGSRAGFSFVEALVVLGITSVLLTLIFSVSTGAVRAGFRAGGRAGDTADRTVGVDALRTLIRAVRLPEKGRSAEPFIGDADGFTAAVAPDRPTPCGPGAPLGALTLRLNRTEGRTRLLCGAPGGRAAVLLDLGAQPARLSYALAGRPWTDRLSARPPPERNPASPPAASSPIPQPPRARLWIRVSGSDGFEVVEAPDAPPPGRTAGA